METAYSAYTSFDDFIWKVIDTLGTYKYIANIGHLPYHVNTK